MCCRRGLNLSLPCFSPSPTSKKDRNMGVFTDYFLNWDGDTICFILILEDLSKSPLELFICKQTICESLPSNKLISHIRYCSFWPENRTIRCIHRSSNHVICLNSKISVMQYKTYVTFIKIVTYWLTLYFASLLQHGFFFVTTITSLLIISSGLTIFCFTTVKKKT